MCHWKKRVDCGVNREFGPVWRALAAIRRLIFSAEFGSGRQTFPRSMLHGLSPICSVSHKGIVITLRIFTPFRYFNCNIDLPGEQPDLVRR
jgi:hypothetical protein